MAAGRNSPQLRFTVDLGKGVEARFAEAVGLELEPAFSAASGSATFPAVDLPPIDGLGNVVLKRGLTDSGSTFWAWLGTVELGVARPRTVTIVQLGAGGAPGRRWTLSAAWPLELTGTALRDDGSQVAIGLVRLAYRTPAALGPAPAPRGRGR